MDIKETKISIYVLQAQRLGKKKKNWIPEQIDCCLCKHKAFNNIKLKGQIQRET